MLRHLSKITASTFKYTSSLFSQYSSHEQISPILVEIWLKDMQTGLDALLNDEMMLAEDTFSAVALATNQQQQQQSPFHAFGYALLIYSKAMLAMERSKMDEAAECLLNVDIMLKRIMNTTRKKQRKSSQPSPPSSTSAPAAAVPISNCKSMHTSHSVPFDIHHEEQQQQRQSEQLATSGHHDGIELQFELLHANCILMTATLQFLKESWIDHIKAAYDLRKAYKIYERLFERVTGVTIAEYETTVIRQQQQQKPSMKTKARRTVSYDNEVLRQQLKHQYHSDTLFDETIEFGAFFGIGLFNVIFSLLPTKVGKILNNLGFQSSRATAIHLLQKSYKSQTMYSPLSALVLLSFYTNISIYIQPHLNQFFHYKEAKCILDKMKQLYPKGQIWYLLEGKMKKLQGKLDDSIVLFRNAKNSPAPQHQKSTKDAFDAVSEEYYFRNCSITEFAQFRSFAIYELGWSYIYTGNYFQASEWLFCLASMCNWSRVFYHYISTCCMMADGLYDKAVLEVRQMINMLDQKKKLGGGRISSNEQYAESRIRYWIETSTRNQTSLKDTLRYQIINPLWELVYLWNGTAYWKNEVVVDMKQKITKQWKEKQDEPILCLFMGVIQRDVEKNIEIALEYFNLVLVTATQNSKKDGWIIPYAMYEIAVTHFSLLLKKRASIGGTSHTSEYKILVSDYVHCIENYYIQNTQDMEWETRMQIRCQLLIESCNSIL